ncbi:MAG: alpha-glucan phosphorylase [Phycisphaerae bacterium SM23_33]|nr:MAG: alpha-glucan phosphorylase [Phycisphaerae bacterium SM23_33]
MRPLRSFRVEPALPENLTGLVELAYNLRWSWRGEIREVFRRLDPKGWDQTGHNPVAMLGQIDQERLEAVSRDSGFLTQFRRALGEQQDYLARGSWWNQNYGEADKPRIGYFCAEFGLTECIPMYSGGLGVLAGDHLKSASDLGVPLAGIGLLYQQGYFGQRLNADGWQLELFPRNDFYNMPVEPVTRDGQPLTAEVAFPGRPVKVRIWVVHVGRVNLYLLDTNVPENSPEDRQITGQLYGGDQEMRIRQEIILGIGGVRALAALGIQPEVFHMNEGHSAFLSLERIRVLMAERGVSFQAAREAVIASNVFTPHTPVPAGNDAFEAWLIEKYFKDFWEKLGLSRNEFLGLGRQDPNNAEEPMSLTVMALRLSSCRNGVSRLHGQVSRRLWSGVWPSLPDHEIPIDHITNGIHTGSWISYDLAGLYDRYLGPDWQEQPADVHVWDAVDQIPDTELWRTHERRRERLVAFARRRLREQLTRRGAGQAELAAAEEVLDAEALTIGFSRRFATYKRANLILQDIERLGRLLNDPKMPVQILFAGKAHPRDNPGKELIRQIVHIARRPEFRRNIVFLEDYDINLTRYMVQGADVWLNTPLRPMEASGTSGMKVAANGGLNVSILDGWWDEGYSPEVGWAIGSGETYEDLDYQNAVESQALYHLLEREVVPMFYNRGPDGLPRQWIGRMKAAMRKLAPCFNTNRMVREYCEKSYLPASERWRKLTADEMGGAQALAEWKRWFLEQFNQVRIEFVHDDMDGVSRVGRPVRVEATVMLGKVSPGDVSVQLYHGQLDPDGQLITGEAVQMEPQGDPDTEGRVRYAADMPCRKSGLAGYTVRVLPRHQAMPDPREMGLVRWA